MVLIMKTLRQQFLTVLCIGLMVASAWADNTTTIAEAPWQRAKALYDAGQPAQAIELLDVLAKSDQEDFNTHWLRGYTLIKLRRYPEAIEVLESTLQWLQDPRDEYAEVIQSLSLKLADAYFLQGQALKKAEQYPEAHARFEQALKIDRRYRPMDAAWGLEQIGDIHLIQGRLTEASAASTSTPLAARPRAR